MSDDLVLMGTAGLSPFLSAAAVFVYIAIHVLLLEMNAFATGDYLFVLFSLVVLLILGAAYWGTGIWLQKTGRI